MLLLKPNLAARVDDRRRGRVHDDRLGGVWFADNADSGCGCVVVVVGGGGCCCDGTITCCGCCGCCCRSASSLLPCGSVGDNDDDDTALTTVTIAVSVTVAASATEEKDDDDDMVPNLSSHDPLCLLLSFWAFCCRCAGKVNPSLHAL